MMSCCQTKDFKGKSIDLDLDLSLMDPLLKEIADQKGSLITILQAAQKIYGYIPLGAMEYIAERTGISAARIYGVATFYTQFRLDPIGENLIMLCKGTACHVNGADLIEEAVREELAIKNGETTRDNLFTLNNVACLGCCSLSPVMMINDETYGQLTAEKTKRIIREIRANSLDSEEAK